MSRDNAARSQDKVSKLVDMNNQNLNMMEKTVTATDNLFKDLTAKLQDAKDNPNDSGGLVEEAHNMVMDFHGSGTMSMNGLQDHNGNSMGNNNGGYNNNDGAEDDY